MSSLGSPSEENHALVEWLGGLEKGDLDVIPTTWIRDFNDGIDFSEESFLVEWRKGQRPKKGWNVYDVRILQIGGDKDLRKVMKQILDRAHAVAKKSEANSKALKHRNILSSLNELGSQESNISDQGSARSNEQGSPERVPEDLGRQLFDLLLNATKGHRSPSNNDAMQAVHADENQVKVGKCLSIPKSCYLESRASRTPSSMTIVLVRAAFSKRRLIKSSYAGQKRTVNGTVTQKPALKKYTKMRDIRDFVLTRFPSFPQSNFGAAVNSCTGKKATEKPAEELVEESESESDMDSE